MMKNNKNDVMFSDPRGVGVDLTTVKELLGHADIKMTLRYAHIASAHKKKAIDILGGKIKAAGAMQSEQLQKSTTAHFRAQSKEKGLSVTDKPLIIMERVAGLEPVTSTLARSRSTN
jgi:hypothetical protein